MSSSVVLENDAVRWFGAAASVAGRDSARPILTGVLVESGPVWSPVFGEFVGVTLTATDSYRLLTVAVRDDSAEPGWVLVPASVKVPARCRRLSLLWDSSEFETVTAAGGGVSGVPDSWTRQALVTVDIGEASTIVGQPGPASDFPNWRQLIPSGDSVGECEPAAVNPVYLGSMLSAIGKAAGKSLNPVRLVASSALRPNLWEWVDTGAGVAASALVMPVRIPGASSDVAGVLSHRDDVAAVAA